MIGARAHFVTKRGGGFTTAVTRPLARRQGALNYTSPIVAELGPGEKMRGT